MHFDLNLKQKMVKNKIYSANDIFANEIAFLYNYN